MWPGTGNGNFTVASAYRLPQSDVDNDSLHVHRKHVWKLEIHQRVESILHVMRDFPLAMVLWMHVPMNLRTGFFNSNLHEWIELNLNCSTKVDNIIKVECFVVFSLSLFVDVE
ncbi:unnamed protein product [Trifolium pratense]|uniref:Uncharacterized protein n=1 Tax=Trifolium pratense TaxID=57577 RepID=A0ACB0MDQ9_TRIPR|nr:unnamed protein product [Trifolium pratense]